MKNENKTYEQGLADAWEAARKIALREQDGGLSIEATKKNYGLPFFERILKNFDAAEAIAKIKAYEDEQQKIKVGDEVIEIDEEDDIPGIVTGIFPLLDNANLCYILWGDGSTDSMKNTELKKTGRHFPQVEKLLKAMKEGQ